METFKEIMQLLVGQWGWLILVTAITFAFKDAIQNLILGIQFLAGSDFNVDDIVWIRGNKKARIVRQNIWKTTFYLYDHDRKFVVPNNMLWKLEIEKDLNGTNP
jgi:small-conductance mechanosensitive channel